eukprot:COSAG02_NODE_9208_length_2288_cov_2.487437_1_plen_474_part_00
MTAAPTAVSAVQAASAPQPVPQKQFSPRWFSEPPASVAAPGPEPHVRTRSSDDSSALRHTTAAAQKRAENEDSPTSSPLQDDDEEKQVVEEEAEEPELQPEPETQPEPELQPQPQQSGTSDRTAAARRKPHWVPDAEAERCMLCKPDWKFRPIPGYKRRHCRACGWAVCSRCLPDGQELELDRWVTAERVVSASDHGVATESQLVCNCCKEHAPAEVAARRKSAEQVAGPPGNSQKPEPGAELGPEPHVRTRSSLRHTTAGAQKRAEVERMEKKPASSLLYEKEGKRKLAPKPCTAQLCFCEQQELREAFEPDAESALKVRYRVLPGAKISVRCGCGLETELIDRIDSTPLHLTAPGLEATRRGKIKLVPDANPRPCREIEAEAAVKIRHVFKRSGKEVTITRLLVNTTPHRMDRGSKKLGWVTFYDDEEQSHKNQIEKVDIDYNSDARRQPQRSLSPLHKKHPPRLYPHRST